MPLPMEYYIHEQSSVMKKLLADRAEIAGEFVKLLLKHQPDRLYMIGSGTSYNTLYAVKDVMAEYLGVDVFVDVPSSLPVVRGRSPLVVFLSQGGNSTNTIAAIEKMKAWPQVAITGMEKCRINELTEHIVMPIGPEEAGPKTKGYFAGYLFLLILALEGGKALGTLSEENYDNAVNELAKSIDALDANVEKADAWVREKASLIGAFRNVDIHSVAVIGKGQGMAAAKEGALKLVETILIPANHYEFEEFLHGPDSLISKTFGGIYFLPPKDDPDRVRMEKVAEYHAKKGGCVFLISPDEEVEGALTLPGGTSPMSMLFSWVLPCQMMGARLPKILGVEGIGHESFVEIDRLVGVKSK